MFHIKVKGKYKSEDDLIQGKPLMQGAVQFEEGAASHYPNGYSDSFKM